MPGRHEIQVLLVAPSIVENEPTGQGKHISDAGSMEYEPMEQLEKLPSMQKAAPVVTCSLLNAVNP